MCHATAGPLESASERILPGGIREPGWRAARRPQDAGLIDSHYSSAHVASANQFCQRENTHRAGGVRLEGFVMINRPNRVRRACRRGLAATETAIMLPLLVIVVFGAIELANGIFLQQTLSVAAYEGARALCRPGATRQEGEQRIAEVLLARDVDDYDIDISPAITATTPRNTEITVSITAPASEYSVGPVRFFQGKALRREVRMVRL